MNKRVYRKLMPRNLEDIPKKFLKIAVFEIKTDCTTSGGTPIVGEQLEILTYEFASNMVLGEKLSRNKHIITGILIGAVATVVAIKIRESIKSDEKES